MCPGPPTQQLGGTTPPPIAPPAKRLSGGAITGIVLGSIGVVALAIFGVVAVSGAGETEAQAPGETSTDRSDSSGSGLGPLWSECRDGNFESCDELYRQAPEGSEYYNFGDTCGNRNEPSGWCVELYSDSSSTTAAFGEYGSDFALDAMWDDCFAGDFQACDDLFFAAPTNSEYREFGDSCGNRNEPAGLCTAIYGSSSGTADSGEYGSDPVLDYLWDWCSDGDWASCDALWQDSPAGSTYEYFGDTCGLRNEPAGWCMDIYG